MVVLAVATLAAAVTVPGILPALAATAWADGNGLSAARLETNPMGDPVAVHLRWPAPVTPVDGFQVVRDGVVVTNAGPTATGAVDPGVAGAGKLGFRYEVRALSGADVIDQLGPLNLMFPASGSECTRVWTGSIGSSWHDAGNWARVGAVAGEPSVPTTSDHSCATTTTNWPITVDQGGAVTKHFTSTLPSAQATLRIAPGGELAIGGVLKSYSLQLAGGDVSIAEDSLLIEAASRVPLELGGGTLALGGTLRGTHPTNGSLQGAVTALADTTTTLDGGRLEMELLRFDTGVKRTIIGRGGVEVAAPVVGVNGTTNLEVGPGGATLLAGAIEDSSDTSSTTIAWTVDRFDRDARLSLLVEGTMDLADLADLGPGGPGEDPDADWNDVDLHLRGSLTLAEPLSSAFRVHAAEAAVLRSGGNPVPWAGVRTFDGLTLGQSVSVAIDGDLRVRDLTLQGSSTLEVEGTILDREDAVDAEAPFQVTLSRGTLRLGETWEVPELGQVGLGVARVEGSILNRGDLYPVLVDEDKPSVATITGDLTVVEGASLSAFVDGPALEWVSSFTVEETLTVDGSIYVSSSDAPGELDVLVVATPNEKPRGTPIDIAVNRVEPDPRPLALDIRDDGYHVVGDGFSSSASWGATDAVQVSGVVVDADGEPVEVGLEWPAPTGNPAELVVERTELGTATDVATLAPDATSYVDDGPVANATYRIFARDADGEELAKLGAPRVVYPPAPGCTIVWTHSAAGTGSDGRWSDERNWAPYGTAGAASLVDGVRIPTFEDRACISSGRSDQGVVVDVDESGTVVGSVVGDRATVAVDRLDSSPGTTFVVVADVEVDRVIANGGSVVGIGGDLRLEHLRVEDGSSVAVGGSLEHVDLNPSMEPGAILEGGDVQTGGWTLPSISALTVFGESAIRGPLTVAGTLTLGPSSQVDMDALETTSTAHFLFGVEGIESPPQLRVTDADLRGTFQVLLIDELPEPTDLLLVATTNPSSTTPSLVLFGKTAGARIVADASGLRVVRNTPAWADGDAVQAAAVTVDSGGAPDAVALSWPAPSGRPNRFEIVRSASGGETVLGTVDGATRTFTDDDPLPRATYAVRARVSVSSGAFTTTDTLGLAEVAFPAEQGCTIIWTHSAAGDASDGDWFDVRNWAPYGTATSSSVGAGVRIPTAMDSACIDTNGPGAGVMVDIARPGAVAASIDGPRAYLGLNRVGRSAASTLVVGGSVELERLGVFEQGSASIGGDLTTTLLFGSGPDASVVVTGEIAHRDGRVGLVKGAILEGAAVRSTGWTLPEDSTLELSGTSRINGAVTAEGTIEVASGADVTIDELTSGSATAWEIDVDAPATPPRVEVPFGLTLDGSMTVDLGAEMANPSELHLIVSGAPMLGTAATSVTGASAGARVQLADDGVRVVRNAPEWGDDQAISVTAMTIDGDGLPVSVALKWPVPSGQADRFDIVRTALGSDTVIGATADGFEKTFVDDDPLPNAAYSIRAIAGSETADELGPVAVAFPATFGCTIVATASADPAGTVDWHDDRNWAPYGSAGSPSLAAGPRVPGPNDHACVDLGTADARRTIELADPGAVRALTGGPFSVVRAVAELAVSGGIAVGQLVLDDLAIVDVSGDLDVEHVSVLGGSELAVAGKIRQSEPSTDPDDPEFRWGASVLDGTVSSPSPWTTPAGATLSLQSAIITAELIIEGTLDLVGGNPQVVGNLSLGTNALVRSDVDPAAPPAMAVEGTLALGGALEVELLAALSAGAELTLIAPEGAGSLTGSFASVDLTGEAEDTEIVVDAAGVRLVRTAVGECAAVPDAVGLEVEGCWVAGPDDTYTAAPDPADPDTMPRVGDVELDPDDGTSLVLDLGAAPPTLVSDGPVAIGIDVTLPARVARWSAGTGTIDWNLGGAPLALPTNRFFTSGLSIAPTITPTSDGWRVRLRPRLGGLFAGAIANLSSTIGADGRLANPTGTVGATRVAEFARVEGMTIAYNDLGRWLLATPTPGGGTQVTGQIVLGATGPISGSIALGTFGLGDLADLDGTVLQFNVLSGSWTADLDGASGARELRLIDTGTAIGGGSHVDLGTLSLGFREQVGPIRISKGAGGGWGLPTPPAPGSLLQQLDLTLRNGGLDTATIRFGDLPPGNGATAPVANAGGWLPIGGLTVTHHPGRDVWTVAGFLDQPRADVVGTVDLDDGRIVAGSFQIPNVNLGSLAVLDLTLAFTTGRTFTLDAALEGPGLTGRPNGTGSLTFAAGGAITAGSLTFAQLPVGELFTIEQFRLAWTASLGRWSASGMIDGPDAGSPPTSVSGGFTFTGGVLTAADLSVAEFRAGPLSIDTFTMALARTGSSGPRESAFTLSGSVRGPAAEVRGGPSAATDAVTGSARLLDGQLTAFSLSVPHIELPGLAYLDGVNIGYALDGMAATLTGSGTVSSAGSGAGAGPSAAFQVRVDDGRVLSASVSLARLPLGGMVTIENFVASYVASAEVPSCSVAIARDADIYAVSGSVRGSTLSGCVALDGRRLVGARLAVDQLEVGELLAVNSFVATYLSSRSYVVPVEGDPRATEATLYRSSLALSGSIAARGGAATNFAGSMVLADGGVESLALTADVIPLSSTVRLEDVEVAFDGGDRFDGRSDLAFSISGSAVHGGGTTTLAGELAFAADGQLQTGAIEVGDLPFGPIVLEDFAFRYERAQATTKWLLDAAVSSPDDRAISVEVTGSATFVDGALTAADLDVPRLSVGEIVLVTDLTLAFSRSAGRSEVWSGSGSVGGLGQAPDPARASVRIQVDAAGAFESGFIDIGHVRWGGLLHLRNLTFTGSVANRQASWAVAASLSIGTGTPTAVTGSLRLSDGRAVAGSLTLRDLSIAELVRIQTLELIVSDRSGITEWGARSTVAFGEGAPVTTNGSMAFERGVLTEASIRLGNAPIGELFRLDSFRIDYQQGRLWSASATVTDEDGTSTLGGSLQFTDGRVTSGSLSIASLQFGPLELSTLELAIGPADTPGPAVCGVADTAGPGIRYTVAATVRSRDGDTTSLAGRLRLDEGNFAEGRLCGSNLKFGDLLILDSVNLSYANSMGPNGRTISFSGSAVAENPSTGGTSSASVAFAIRDRQLQTLSVTAGGIEVGDLLKLANLEFSYNRTINATAWVFDSTVVQDGPDATLSGSLTVVDGTITGGSLTASEIRFGDLFVLEEMEIDYFGRAIVAPTLGGVSSGANSSCGATPNDSNVPTGFPRGTGSFSQFSVSAVVRANNDTYAARGQLLFGDGDLVGFDVTLACLPIGDFKTLEAVRIAKRPGQLQFSGRLQDPDGTTSATGSFVFDDGRLTGGRVRLREVPIGPIQINRLDVVIGQTATGNTEYGLTVVLAAGDSAPVGGGGSLIMDDGRVVGGSLNLSGIKVFDLFRIDELELDIDGSVPGRVRFAVGLGVSFPPAGGSGGNGGHVGQGSGGSGDDDAGFEVAVSITMVDGRVTAGSFTLGAIKLFDAVPLGRVSAEFNGEEGRWAAELEMQIGQNGPAFVLGAEFERGKLLSGTVGFDLNGDGEPDGSPGQAPPAGGNAQMSWFPLKAAYIVYCSSEATASYCPGNGVSQWAGRLGIELPTDAAPAIDVSVDIRDGILVEASAWIDFGVGIMVYPPVWLESIGFSFGLKPFNASGTIGLALGTGVVDIADITGWVAAGEGPPLAPDESPLDYESDYIYFASGGSVELFDLPVGGDFVSIFQSNGYLGFGGSIGIDILEDTFSVVGGMEGAIFNASGAGFNLTNPETGQPLSGWHAQAHGFVSASIFGINVASAEGYISDIGATAFGQVAFLGCAGVGVYWSTGRVRETCDYGRYIVEGVNPSDSPLIPNSVTRSSAARSAGTKAAPEVEFAELEVAPGEDVLGVTVSGFGSALDDSDPTPDVALMAPDGTVYGARNVDDADPSDGTIIASAPNNRWFFIDDPQPGTWRLESTPGSVAIEEVALSRKLPPVDVRGSVAQAGRQAVVDYELTPLDGQEVLFVERSVGSTDDFESGIGTATGASGQMRFTPAGGSRAGTREVFAVVMQEGFRRQEISLGTFQMGPGGPASKPQQVRATEIAGGARVSWQPPADDGGRRITSYRVFSDLGFDVAVDAQDLTVDVPIPAMEPGEEVPIYVEARTGVGWGYSGTTSITSTQTTGWQYKQHQVPRSSWVDGPTVPADPTDPTDPTDPADPADPVDPFGPGGPSGPGATGAAPSTPVGTLARTGSELMATWWWGMLLVLAGSAFVWFGRRRRTGSPPT